MSDSSGHSGDHGAHSDHSGSNHGHDASPSHSSHGHGAGGDFASHNDVSISLGTDFGHTGHAVPAPADNYTCHDAVVDHDVAWGHLTQDMAGYADSVWGAHHFGSIAPIVQDAAEVHSAGVQMDFYCDN